MASPDGVGLLREQGNAAFKAGNFEHAVDYYSQALSECCELSGSNSALANALNVSRSLGKNSDLAGVDEKDINVDTSMVVGDNTEDTNSSAAAVIAKAAMTTGAREDARSVAANLESIATLLCNRSAALAKLARFDEALRDAEQTVALRPGWVKGHHRKAQALVELGMLEEARDTYCLAAELDPENAYLRKQVELLEKQTGLQSAQTKIDTYLEKHSTIKGCPTKLSLSMFEVDELLGEGNYSMVHSATFKATGERFAIKSVDKEKAKRMSRRHPNLHNELVMEKRLLLRLSHPNVVKLFFTMQDVRNLYYVTELATAGELWARLRYGRAALVSLRPSEALFFSAQIINALEYLQTQGVIHRDIKPENMMLFSEPESGGRVERLKLIDFGTAYDTEDKELNGPHFVGTPEYMSPEAIAGKAAPTFALDLWALGATLFQLHSGRIPFKGNSPYLTFLKTQALNYEMPNYFSIDLQDLLSKIFVEEPSERLGANDCLASIKQHPAFEGVDFAAILQQPVKPVPTLFELCAEGVVQVLTGPPPPLKGPGSNVRLPEFPKPKTLPDWAKTPGTFAEPKTDTKVRNTLMGMLAQRLALRNQHIFKLFFPSEEAARFQRAAGHGFAGMSEAEENKFKDSFLLVHLGSLADLDTDQVEATMRRINRLEPAPRLVVCGGSLGEASVLKPALCRLDMNIALACVPDGRPAADYKEAFGDMYYSLYIQGVLVIVIDSFQLAKLDHEGGDEEAEKQAKWLEHMVLEGKVCAHHVIIFSHHMWLFEEDQAAGQESHISHVMPASVRDRFVDKFQESGVQLVLCGAAETAITKVRKPRNEMEPKLRLSSTPPHKGSESDGLGILRIVRVQPSDVVTDLYSRASLPSWFALEEQPPDSDEEQEPDGSKPQFSDISSDSSDDDDDDE